MKPPAYTYTAINKDSAHRWMAEYFERLVSFVDLNEELNVEEFSRLAARAFVSSLDHVTSDYFGVLYDLKKAASYGASHGAMDSTLCMNPYDMIEQYSYRKDLEMN